MASKNFCQGCVQNNDCRRVGGQLGNESGASIVLKVILAFLLPLIVFIVSLAVFEKVLAGTFNTERLQTVVSFLLALLVTFACILITRVIRKSFNSDN